MKIIKTQRDQTGIVGMQIEFGKRRVFAVGATKQEATESAKQQNKVMAGRSNASA